jgi:hypothetical protein
MPSKAEYLIEEIKRTSELPKKVQLLTLLAKQIEPSDNAGLQFIFQVANYNLIPGLAPYGKKVVGFISEKYPGINFGRTKVAIEHEADYKSLNDEDFRERLRVLEHFECDYITEVVPLLIERLKKEDHPWVVSKLTKVTGILGAAYDNEEVIDALLPFLHHEDDRIRANTVEGIGGLESPRKIPILLKMLCNDESERARQMAAVAISFDDVNKAFGLLRVMLDSDDETEWDKALAALKYFDLIEAKEMLEEYKAVTEERKKAKVEQEQLLHSDEEFITVEQEPELADEVLADFAQDLQNLISTEQAETEDPLTTLTLDETPLTLSSESPVTTDRVFLPEESATGAKSTEKPAPKQEVPVITSPPINEDNVRNILQSFTGEMKIMLGDFSSGLKTEIKAMVETAMSSRLAETIATIMENIQENLHKTLKETINSTVHSTVNETLKSTIHSSVQESMQENLIPALQKINSHTTQRPAIQSPFAENIDQNNHRNKTEKIEPEEESFTENPDAEAHRILFAPSENSPKSRRKYPIFAFFTVVTAGFVIWYFATPGQKTKTDPQTEIITVLKPESTTGTEYTDIKGSETTKGTEVKPESNIKDKPESNTEAKPESETEQNRTAAETGRTVEKAENPVTKIVKDTEQAESSAIIKTPEPVKMTATAKNDSPEITSPYNINTTTTESQNLKTTPTDSLPLPVATDGHNCINIKEKERYCGFFANGLFHGEGIYTWPDGQRYEGSYVEGERQGQGIMNYANRDVYSGEWLNGLFHGRGKLIFGEGGYYEGEFKSGNFHGQGLRVHADGMTHDGNWINGAANGEGLRTWPSTALCQGTWQEGSLNGKGRCEWPDNSAYEGEFQQGHPSGEGVMHYTNGNRYEGQFRNGLPHGKGVFYGSDQTVYKGEWENGRKHGRGVLIFADGERYDGEWLNDQENGQGVYSWNSGDRYMGEWKNGKRHGLGTFISSDEQKLAGLWRENLFIGREVHNFFLKDL